MRIKQHYLFPILDVLLNGVNYFFHIFVSWYLLGGDYGKLGALLSILSILLVFGLSTQTYIAKMVASNSMDKEHLRKIKLRLVFFMIALFIGGYLFQEQFQTVTRTGSLELLLLFFVFATNLILCSYRGFFQGTKQFLLINVSMYVEVGVKIALIVFLLKEFPSIVFILFSILIGMIASLLLARYQYAKLDVKKLETTSVHRIFKDIFIIVCANFFLYCFTSIDMIVVNYYLPDSSSVFSVLLKYSQLILFVSLSLITVFIPYLSEQKEHTQRLMKVIIRLIGLVSFVGVSAVISFYTFVPYTVTWLFGEVYEEAGQYLFQGAIAYSILVLSYVLVNVNIVLGRTRFIYYMFLFIIILVTVLINFNDSIVHVLFVETFLYSLLFIVLAFDTFYSLARVK